MPVQLSPLAQRMMSTNPPMVGSFQVADPVRRELIKILQQLGGKMTPIRSTAPQAFGPVKMIPDPRGFSVEAPANTGSDVLDAAVKWMQQYMAGR